MSLVSRILQPHALESLERAIATLRSDDPLRDQLIHARDTSLKQIEPLALLQPEASRLLVGDHLAARRFEALLEKLAVETEPEADSAASVAEEGQAPTTVSRDTSEAREQGDERRDDPFVHLDNLLAISVALGVLPLDEPRFLSLFGALTTCTGAILELEALTAAALIFLKHGDPQPMQTLAWRAKAPRPKRKAKPSRKPKPKRPRIRFKSKIKDTHSAFMSCFRGAAYRARAESLAAPKFSVTSVSPIDACPGHTITIRGTNFGTGGGTVAFHTPSGSATEYSAVNADSWSDTAIVVTVPAWAREGRLHVSPTDHVFVTCFRKWAVNRMPDPNGFQNDDFLGGLPDIFALQVNGRDFKAWAAPGSQAHVSWVTTPGTLKIEIRNEEDAFETHFKSPPLAGGTGSIEWPTKALTTPTKYLVRLTSHQSLRFGQQRARDIRHRAGGAGNRWSGGHAGDPGLLDHRRSAEYRADGGVQRHDRPPVRVFKPQRVHERQVVTLHRVADDRRSDVSADQRSACREYQRWRPLSGSGIRRRRSFESSQTAHSTSASRWPSALGRSHLKSKYGASMSLGFSRASHSSSAGLGRQKLR